MWIGIFAWLIVLALFAVGKLDVVLVSVLFVTLVFLCKWIYYRYIYDRIDEIVQRRKEKRLSKEELSNDVPALTREEGLKLWEQKYGSKHPARVIKERQ